MRIFILCQLNLSGNQIPKATIYLETICITRPSNRNITNNYTLITKMPKTIAFWTRLLKIQFTPDQRSKSKPIRIPLWQYHLVNNNRERVRFQSQSPLGLYLENMKLYISKHQTEVNKIWKLGIT